jgi:hypothetical protein
VVKSQWISEAKFFELRELSPQSQLLENVRQLDERAKNNLFPENFNCVATQRFRIYVTLNTETLSRGYESKLKKLN